MARSCSIVVPVFNEAESLKELSDRVHAVFVGRPDVDRFEILFVDDGSTDGTPDILTQIMAERPAVRCLRFRRNSGKSLALMAAFQTVDSDVVITLDGDLQDMPEEIFELISKLDEGYDMVTGWRRTRQDQASRRLGSRLFNFTVGRATGLRLHDLNCGFKVFSRDVIASLCIYGDYHRYIPVQVHLSGFRVTEYPVSNHARRHGTSKYRTFRYKGFFDLLSLLFIYKYGLTPLHFFGTVAALLIIPSCLMLLWFTSQQIMYWLGYGTEYLVLNRPLLAISLTSLMMGVVFLFTGFVCDFVLHHQIRDRISSIINSRIAKDFGNRASASAESPLPQRLEQSRKNPARS
jgi:glycosyltransferase involved in cell wall biosynthesis